MYTGNLKPSTMMKGRATRSAVSLRARPTSTSTCTRVLEYESDFVIFEASETDSSEDMSDMDLSNIESESACSRKGQGLQADACG